MRPVCYYEIDQIRPKEGLISSTHGTILGRRCQVMDLEPGQRGWLLVDVGDDSFGPHRIALSNVISVTGDDNLIIETENTFYTLKRITPKEEVNMIVRNAIRCNICGDEIESTHRHDYVECKCGACAVDGGHDYLRRCFKSPDCFTDISICKPDPQKETLD